MIFKKKHYLLFTIITLLVFYLFSLPSPLFNDPTSTIIEDNKGNLLAAQIASDGQWRFPEINQVPEKFEKCIIYFEDQYFYKHPGINPVSITRALKQNIKAKRTISGGSTLTSQTIRLARKSKKRNVWQKVIEFTLATRLELRFSKKEILSLYASHAPFGGNVVGLETASWRYYGRSPSKLSWGETATLAVLPNAPSLIFPGKNHELLLKKRNRLLDKLLFNNIIDSLACELAKQEPLPGKPKALPQLAPHLLTRAINDRKTGQRISSTINKPTQLFANRIVHKHHQVLAQNGIMNAAALVIEVETGNVLAYIGNTTSTKNKSDNFVDIITSARSTGSTLKPFLYALMQKEGIILPKTLIPDIPTQIAGYAPKNFDKKYNGAVSANLALSRSLNIPAVKMLKQYGLEHFTDQLKALKLSTINKHANHYGLSLILGGAETTLWDLSSVYSSMARVLNHYANQNSQYNSSDYHSITFEPEAENTDKNKFQNHDIFGASAIWLTFEALTEMDRPVDGTNWKLFSSSRKVAWKTGTSFGFRDAWAVGVTPEYVVAVWVGNADGEGRPNLTGTRAAAPIMFDLFKQLPQTTWFNAPYDDLEPLEVCAISGHKASELCEIIDTIYISKKGIRTEPCPYHKRIHLNKLETFQVNSNCYPVSEIVTKPWFVLPPVMEWYYKNNDPFYKTLPPFHPDCASAESNNMEIIYPKESAKLYMPRGFNQQQLTVFEVAHRLPKATVHWHLDEVFLESTTGIHKMEIFANEGFHTLTLVDDSGETEIRVFEVLAR